MKESKAVAIISNFIVFLIAALVGGGTMFYVIPVTARAKGNNLFNLNIIVVLCTFCMWAWCWLYAALSDPGFVDEDLKRRGYYENVKDGNIPTFLSGLPICQHCHMPMPPAAIHCRDCDRCVLREDHHCGVLGQCVGDMNFKAFIQSFFYAAFLSIESGAYGIYGAFFGKEFNIFGLIIGVYGFILSIMMLGFGFSFFNMGRSNRSTGSKKIPMDEYLKSFGTQFWQFFVPIQRTSTNLAWPGIEWEFNEPLHLL